jgi:DNA replication and repair protein RecF
MRIERIALRDFRSYEGAELSLGPGLTIVHGPNGAGKTNLLEGLYFGCTGRSFRTSDERRLVRHGARAARVEFCGVDGDGRHELAVGLEPGQAKRMTGDGAPVERLLDVPFRPLISVFSPDRLELIKGGPGLRRAHLDQVVAALWPTRAVTRREYGSALAQRNALIGRIRAGQATAGALAAWNATLAASAVQLARNRADAAALIAQRFARRVEEFGLSGEVSVSYRSGSQALTPGEFTAELERHLETDLSRGYTTYGPHRDDLRFSRDGRNLRHYGSQGEQRVTLLALLLVEREIVQEQRRTPLLLLLDDVMSELDQARRALLAAELRREGQSVVTTTEADHVPGWDQEDVTRIALT